MWRRNNKIAKREKQKRQKEKIYSNKSTREREANQNISSSNTFSSLVCVVVAACFVYSFSSNDNSDIREWWWCVCECVCDRRQSVATQFCFFCFLFLARQCNEPQFAHTNVIFLSLCVALVWRIIYLFSNVRLSYIYILFSSLLNSHHLRFRFRAYLPYYTVCVECQWVRIHRKYNEMKTAKWTSGNDYRQIILLQ